MGVPFISIMPIRDTSGQSQQEVNGCFRGGECMLLPSGESPLAASRKRTCLCDVRSLVFAHQPVSLPVAEAGSYPYSLMLVFYLNGYDLLCKSVL